MSDEPPTTPPTTDRARSFGAVADAYDRGRPTYPAEAVAWLDTLDPSVDLPEIRLHAVTRGPSARAPVVPLEVERRAAK